MKYLILLAFACVTSFGFAQDTGMIIGKVTDKEFNNEPLVFANVSVKGSNINSTTDVTGVFLLENLADGIHTLICSFPGYENEEFEVTIVEGQPTEIEVGLNARKLTFNTASVASSSENLSGTKTAEKAEQTLQ